MLNNDVKLIGVAVSNFKEEGKVAKFEVELTKQKSGEPYTIELVAYTNSKSINFKESIKGKLVAVSGFLAVNDRQIQVNVTNVMTLGGNNAAEPTTSPAPVITSKDLENNDLVITEDDLPF